MATEVKYKCYGCHWYWYESELKQGCCPNCGARVI